MKMPARLYRREFVVPIRYGSAFKSLMMRLYNFYNHDDPMDVKDLIRLLSDITKNAKNMFSLSRQLPTFELDGEVFEYSGDTARKFKEVIDKLRRLKRIHYTMPIMPEVIADAFA